MADKREVTNRRKGIGVAQMAALQAIAVGRGDDREIRVVLKAYVSGPAASVMLDRLKAAGMIGWHSRGQRWYVTPKGAEQLPRVRDVPAMRPYVPPQAPPRRDGSMSFAGVRSVAAGVQREWRHPC